MPCHSPAWMVYAYAAIQLPIRLQYVLCWQMPAIFTMFVSARAPLRQKIPSVTVALELATFHRHTNTNAYRKIE